MKSNLTYLLQEHAEKNPLKLAFSFLKDKEEQNQHLTFQELDEAGRAIGATLQMVAGKGERALLLFQPGMDFVKAFVGCMYSGVVAVPAYPPNMNRIASSLGRLQSIVEDSEAMVILTTADLLPKIQEATRQIPGFEGILLQAIDRVPASRKHMWEDPELVDEDLAFLQYTSGSTSAPKGVMVSHGNVFYNEQMIHHAVGFGKDYNIVGWLPLFHDMGLIGIMLHGIFKGTHTRLMSPMSFLKQPIRWLKAISEAGPCLTAAPNFAYDLCLRRISDDQLEGIDLSQWFYAFNGAEPVRRSTLDAFTERFGKAGMPETTLHPCYGLAEATLFVTGNAPTTPYTSLRLDQAELEAGKAVVVGEDADNVLEVVSCGITTLDEQLAIVAPEDGHTCADGEIGEIWVKGPHVAQGYWKNEASTEINFRAETQEGEGPFMRTGDLGFLRDGELYVTGRLKEIIIVRGRCLYPQDLELVVEHLNADFPEVRPNGTVAFSVEGTNGEDIALLVEVAPRRNPNYDADQLVQAIQQALLERFDVGLSEIVMVKTSLPKTSSGKKMRMACRKALQTDISELAKVVHHWRLKEVVEEVVAEAEAALPELESEGAAELERTILKWIADETQVPVEQLAADRPFTDFGLDSLSAISLVEFLEKKLGRPLSTTLVYDHPTPRHLVQHLVGQPA